MSPLEPLAPDQRAVVALVLQQGRSYDEIAALLGMPVDEVRARAQAGLAALAHDNGLPGEITGPLADYLLGQQPARDAEAARRLLAESAPARAWATGVADRGGRARRRSEPGRDAAPDRPLAGVPAPAPRPRLARERPPATAGPASRRGRRRAADRRVVALVASCCSSALRGGDDARGPAVAAAPAAAATATPTPTRRRLRRWRTRSRCVPRRRRAPRAR